jgi:heptaprenyl diphosphate synthase
VIDYWKGSPALERRLERVLAVISRTIEEAGFPFDDLEAAAGSGGKLLRPALLLVGSEFGAEADPSRIERLAAAVELLHLATLVHDDIIDEAPIRRGKPSLHASVGTKEAVLAGDWLFSRCFLLGAESAGPENARGLARLVAAVCSAEIAQDAAKFAFDATPRGYFRTIAGKTAALFSLALYAGASEAKAGRKAEQSLRRSGYCIGMAFQVMDDILDFESEEGLARKPVGRDIAEGLCTLPLIYALRIDGPGMRAALAPLAALRPTAPMSALGPGAEGPAVAPSGAERDSAARDAAAKVIALGALDRAREDARRFTARALGEIGALRRGPARDELAALAERLLHRTY